VKERNVLSAFGRALVEKPLSKLLLLLDLVGVAAVVVWVVDDWLEAAVILVFLVVVLSSFYLVFREIWSSSQSSPRILFDQVRQAQIYQPSQILEQRVPSYNLLQLWFLNTPTLPLDASVARQVTAKVTLERPDGTTLIEYYGQWARSNAPDNVGFEDYVDKIDIPPGHLRAKLMIALKYPGESQAYAFTREGLKSHRDGRSPRYVIPEGTHKATVHLSGIGLDVRFTCQLSNGGSGTSLQLSDIRLV